MSLLHICSKPLIFKPLILSLGVFTALCCISVDYTYAQGLDILDNPEGEFDQNQGEDFDFLPDPSGPQNDIFGGGDDFNFEKSAEELQNETRKDAFEAALQSLLPLKPEEIRKLLEEYDKTEESVEVPIYPAPQPKVAVETLSVDPGTLPNTISLSHGYVTTFNVVDTTGEPWPINMITWAGNFDIITTTADSDPSNILLISPQSPYSTGNMSIKLIGMDTPIIISLETRRDYVHYRYDAIVPKKGPMAKVSFIENGTDLVAGNVDLSNILEGAVPKSAYKMKISGVDGRTSAYRLKGLTYLRTPLTLLSPAWISSASSADGMRVYALAHSPVILLSENGKTRQVRLSEREDLFDE